MLLHHLAASTSSGVVGYVTQPSALTSSLERYKTHLVARGFQQEQSHDYDEAFAPVAHMITIHTLLIVTFIQE
jgi:hypothetical protein